MHAVPDAPTAREGVGRYALALGIVAVLCLVVPMIGDVLAALPALAAVILGIIALHRYEARRDARVWPAIIGAALGAIVLFVIVTMFVVTTLFR
ncbi:hypothetical protein [Microbacterium sp. G2-8]|uniref:hypothetical protein n=1 Tax=Microbacterium sp. G2-8 TaxID=2842454 RepID=UPI001C8A61DD|nr:hypothetical protein [Microbacterium sp. G2-8]